MTFLISGEPKGDIQNVAQLMWPLFMIRNGVWPQRTKTMMPLCQQ